MLEDLKGDDIRLRLAYDGKDTFIFVDVEEPDMRWECELGSPKEPLPFECAPLVMVEEFKPLDAVLYQEFHLNGAFESSTEATVMISLDISCKGSQCKQVAAMSGFPLPCLSSINGEMEHM